MDHEAPKIHLVSFADSRLEKARKRFSKQAERFGEFASITVFNEFQLEKNFQNQAKDLLRPGIRGFGFWLWKPQVIIQVAHTVPSGEYVLYLDVGFHLNPSGKIQFRKYIEDLKNSDSSFLVFQAFQDESTQDFGSRDLPDLRDSTWTKGDLIDFFNLRGDPKVIEPTVGAGALLLKVEARSLAFLIRWRDLMVDNPNLLDDTPSESLNMDGFKANRHDQSFFSLMIKSEDENLSIRRSAFNYWVPKKGKKGVPDWKALRSFPFHARRDLGLARKFRLESLSFLFYQELKIWRRENGR